MLENFRIDDYPVGIAAILLSVAVIITCQIIITRFIGKEALRKSHEVGGYYLSLVGTTYAVLLGLVVFDAMAKFQRAEKIVQTEAKSVVAVYSISEQFPKEEAIIKGLLRDYVDEVINNEWSMMGKGEISEKARHLVLTLIHTIKKIEPITQNQQGVYPTLISETVSLWESRQDRTRPANFGIPTAEWVILLIGAAITISFTFFFTIETQGIDIVMRGMATVLIAISLYLVLLFGAPFGGDLRVSDEPFSAVRNIITKYL